MFTISFLPCVATFWWIHVPFYIMMSIRFVMGTSDLILLEAAVILFSQDSAGYPRVPAGDFIGVRYAAVGYGNATTVSEEVPAESVFKSL